MIEIDYNNSDRVLINEEEMKAHGNSRYPPRPLYKDVLKPKYVQYDTNGEK